MALSNASGPSSTPPVICPRSAILHSAAASIVDGILEVTVSTADRIATRGVVPKPACIIEIDRVLDDVALAVEIGEDVDRRIGDEQRLGIGRHVHDEDVADAPVGAQSADLRRDAAHQFVGMQAALHQHFALARVDQFDAPWRRLPRCAAASTISKPAMFETVLGCGVPDLGRRARRGSA